jgi:glycosyltransferase involved in cell wall biosynthesis
MPAVLHVLPHPGGGGETYVDLLEGLGGFRHERLTLSPTRSRARGVVAVALRRRGIVRRARGADLVHVHGDMAAMLIAPALAARPLVITTHGLHRLRRSDRLGARLVRHRLTAAVAAATRVICHTREERDDLVAVLPASLHERLSVVPNGVALPPAVDPEHRGRTRAELGLDEDEVAIVFAAQLEERKDPLGAIGAVEAARADGAKVVLLLAGDGPLAVEVGARAGDGVHVLGRRDDLERLFTAGDLFLLPSAREGMSFALLEAMGHGLVPVVADGAGNAETIADSGLVYAAGDARALTAVLTRLAADPGERARLGAAARERIGGELSLELFLSGTRAQYEAALGGLREPGRDAPATPA